MMAELMLDEEESGTGSGGKEKTQKEKKKKKEKEKERKNNDAEQGGGGLTGGATANAPALDSEDEDVAIALSHILRHHGADWSSTSPARLREMFKEENKEHGEVCSVRPELAVSEKRMKKIKAWALANPAAVAELPVVQADTVTSTVKASRARSSRSEKVCAECGISGCNLVKKMSLCSACRQVSYCSPECQKLHWKEHKKACKAHGATTSAK